MNSEKWNMPNHTVADRLLASGYQPLWFNGKLIYTKPDTRTPLQRELGVFDFELRPSVNAYRIAMREMGVNFGPRGVFARSLLWAAYARPLTDSPTKFIEDAAHTVILACSAPLGEFASKYGFRLDEHDSAITGVHREIVETLPNCPTVKRMVGRVLREERDNVFNDTSLTLNDPNVFVVTANNSGFINPSMIEDAGMSKNEMTERVRTTVYRTIEYIDFIQPRDKRGRFFKLYRCLTRIRVVGESILEDDF
ncbi:hypothetical protein [Sphingomonas mucosissima]|uniref:Uncharacterized protein n=1 Tax=Sphingomonas mucosissima TaxID=370959 RepID=A0A245ZGT9_9SPHN|nr:hypothetical protein [Sphingomonas mucosissima]OWK28962.1 hypothetical protein SPMU_24880 [Sphingomonas mucosissima]